VNLIQSSRTACSQDNKTQGCKIKLPEILKFKYNNDHLQTKLQKFKITNSAHILEMYNKF